MISRIIAVLLLLAPLPAVGAYFTYAEWAALSPELRALYMAGTFDTFISTMAAQDDGGSVGRHYASCIKQAAMNVGQLSENILQFASTRPQLQTGTVLQAMADYLIAACGRSP
jgi:hypothetical protein